MYRRFSPPLIALIALAALLTACGGSKATDTPKPAVPTIAAAAPTTAPATAPTTAAGSASAVAATTAPTTAPTPAPTTAPTAAATAVAATRPAGSATTGSVTAGTTAAGSTAAGTGLTLFTDPKGRFSFSRPAAWTAEQSTTPGSVVQFNSTNPLGIVDITTGDAPSGVAPEEYHDRALVQIKKTIADAQEVGTLPLKLDTEPAIQIDYTGTVNGTKIYFSQIFAVHKGTAYVLTLGTQPADIDKMKQQAIVVVQTWKFLQ